MGLEENKLGLLRQEVENEMISRLDLIHYKKTHIYEVVSEDFSQSRLLERLYPNRKKISIEKLQNSKLQEFATLIFSNLFFVDYPLKNFFENCIKLMNNESLLLFAVIGNGSFKEIQKFPYENQWTIQEIGETLLQLGFYQPVLDVEKITICYRNSIELVSDLKQNALIQDLTLNPEISRISLQVIYGHAWGCEQKKDLEVKIPLSDFIKGLTIKQNS